MNDAPEGNFIDLLADTVIESQEDIVVDSTNDAATSAQSQSKRPSEESVEMETEDPPEVKRRKMEMGSLQMVPIGPRETCAKTSTSVEIANLLSTHLHVHSDSQEEACALSQHSKQWDIKNFMEELEEQNKLKFLDHYDDMELMNNKKIHSQLLASAELGEGVFNLAVLQPTTFSVDTPQTQ